MEIALRAGMQILYIIMLFGGLLYLPRLVFMFFGFKKQKAFKTAPMINRYAILIPARNESRVIESLLKSIQNQTYPAQLLDVYVMVTDEKDPTCDICKKYNVKKVLVVPPDLNSKGKTLDICFKDILSNCPDLYSAHFIFDADNILAPNFIEKMNDVYCKGYKVAMGRRTNKSWNYGFVSNSSFLTFTYINTLSNKFRTKMGSSITVSGSGFYVDNSLIKSWGGWPFYSITEDYEFSKWLLMNDIAAYYCESAVVADEQPTTMKQSNAQRFRWIKGHNIIDAEHNKKLLKQTLSKNAKHKFIKLDYLFSLVPVIFMLVGLVLFILYSAGIFVWALIVGSYIWKIALGYMLKTLLALYGLLLIHTSFGFIADRDIIKIGFLNGLILFLAYPFFMITWVPLYFKSFFVEKVEWKTIEHKINV